MRRLRDLQRSARGDEGFTLVEILVAFLIIAIIAAAGTSLTIRGMRATLDAKQLSQAKNLVNLQVEEMRGLPYFVSYTTSTAKTDVLDWHYPDLSVAGAPDCAADAVTWANPTNATAWSGYVADGAARCSFEPGYDPDTPTTGDGAFYRTVEAATIGSAPAALVVATQFVGLAVGEGDKAPWVAPQSTYAWNALDQDFPASSQIAAYVSAIYGPGGSQVHRTTTRTDIADRRGGPPLVTAETNAAAVVVEGTLGSGVAQRLEIGSVSGEGSVTVLTTAAVEAVGGSMQTSSGRVDGAAQIATSPGAVTGTSTDGTRASGAMSIGATSTTGVNATSTVSDPGFGAPAVGSAAGGTFSLEQNRPGLNLSSANPIVRVDSNAPAELPGGGGCPIASGIYGAAGAGWMNTGVLSPKTLSACAQSEAKTVKLFPDAVTAPDGLLQIVANDVIARCSITGATPSGAASGSVTVRWLTASPSTYAEATVTLDASGVTGALPDRATTILANGKRIGTYIASWAAFTGAGTVLDPTATARSAAAKVPAALSLTTVPVRMLGAVVLDEDSRVKLTVGRAICSGTDRR